MPWVQNLAAPQRVTLGLDPRALYLLLTPSIVTPAKAGAHLEISGWIQALAGVIADGWGAQPKLNPLLKLCI